MASNPQRASLYQRKGTILAYPEHRTAAGFYISDEPYAAVPDLLPRSIGRAVLTALADSRVAVAEPGRSEWIALAKKRLKAAGVASESSFMQGALLLSVEHHDGLVEVIPHKNGGASGKERRFHALPEHAIITPASGDEASIGTACIEALSKCQ